MGAPETPAEVGGVRVDSSQVLKILGTADELTVPYWFNDWHPAYQELARVEFAADGTVWDVATLKQRVLQGTTDADTLIGYESADTLGGLGGADTLYGDGGDDRLDGGG